MLSSDLHALYKNHRITLWVEDELTSAYLNAVWGPQGDIGIRVAGNSESVKNIVDLARRRQLVNVFGLIDRDFGSGGFASWRATSSVLRLDTHEIENFLLDPDTLAGNILDTARRSVPDVSAKLHAGASLMVWGMALGATTYWMVGERNHDFPSQGSLAHVPDRAAALQRIYGGTWPTAFASLPSRIGRPAVE